MSRTAQTLLELRRLAQPTLDLEADLEVFLARRRWLPNLAGGDLDVLLRQSVDDVAGGETALGEAVGVQPNAHRELALAEVVHERDVLERVRRAEAEVADDRAVHEIQAV